MEKRNISFSPPDITEDEINLVAECLRSGWITTGPKTKLFEQKIADYTEVITSAYTYTASASPVIHVGASLKLVDTSKDSYEFDMDSLKAAITENTKVIIPVDIGGVPCDYQTIYKIVEEKKSLFNPRNDVQKRFGRIIVVADCAHGFGASANIDGQVKMAGNIADFTSFSLAIT